MKNNVLLLFFWALLYLFSSALTAASPVSANIPNPDIEFRAQTAAAILQLNVQMAKNIEEIKCLKEQNKPLHFTVTAYSARTKECDATPHVTAIMEAPKVGWTVAVSQDYKHMLGKKVYIEGFGVHRVNDLMNERYTKRIDVLVKSPRDARRFGVKKNVQIVFLGEEE